MGNLIINIPHVVFIKRRGYKDAYFKVHIKDRPDGWKPSIILGRTDQVSIEDITIKARSIYNDYIDFKDKYVTKENRDTRKGSIPDIILLYRTSHFWKDLSPRTRKDYNSYLTLIHDWSRRNGHPHIEKMTKKHIVAWLSTFEETPTKQKRLKVVLSILFSTACNEGYVEDNPIRDIKLRKNKKEKRPITIWTEEDIDRFVIEADKQGYTSLGSIALTMIETAQRKGDVIRMINHTDYKNGQLAYLQNKTKKTVWMNATDKLKHRYSFVGIGSEKMFINEHTSRPWTEYNVTHVVRKICDSIGMKDHIIMHLRHSQINYLYELGLGDQTIIAITGHERPETMRTYYREKRNEKLANEGIAYINKKRMENDSITKKVSHEYHT